MNKQTANLMLLIILTCACFAADSTYYLNDSRSLGGWSAGGGGNNGLSKSAPWNSLVYAIDHHDSTSGDTVKLIIRPGATIQVSSLAFDNVGGMHDGINFVIEGEDHDSWTMDTVSYGGDIFDISGCTSGSISLSDCAVHSSNPRYFFRLQDGSGMNIFVDNSSIALTGASSRFYYAGASGGVRDFTVTNTTVSSCSLSYLNTGDVNDIIITSSSLTSTDDISVYLTGRADSFILDGSTLSAGVRGISKTGTSSVPLFKVKDSTITSDSYGILVFEGVDHFILSDSSVTSANETGIQLGRDTDSDSIAIGNCLINNTTVRSVSYKHRAVEFDFDMGDIEITKSNLYGYSHTLFINSGTGTVNNSYINSKASVGFGCFTDNLKVHNNYVYTSGTVAFTSGAPGGTIRLSARNLKVHHNIFVSEDNYAFTDYDDSTGLDGGRGIADAMNDYMDYNIYWRNKEMTPGVCIIGQNGFQQACETISEMQTAWQTATADGSAWNRAFKDINDRHSRIYDTAGRTGTRLDIDGDGEKEWVGIPSDDSNPFYRSEYLVIFHWLTSNPEADFNKDGIVNLEDFYYYK